MENRHPDGLPAGQREDIAQVTPPPHDETAAVAPERIPARGRFPAFLLIGIIMGLAVAGSIGYFAGINQNIANEQPLAQAPAMADPVPADRVMAEPAIAGQCPPEQRPPAENFAGLTLDGEEFDLAQTTGTPTLLVFWAHW